VVRIARTPKRWPKRHCHSNRRFLNAKARAGGFGRASLQPGSPKQGNHEACLPSPQRGGLGQATGDHQIGLALVFNAGGPSGRVLQASGTPDRAAAASPDQSARSRLRDELGFSTYSVIHTRLYRVHPVRLSRAARSADRAPATRPCPALAFNWPSATITSPRSSTVFRPDLSHAVPPQRVIATLSCRSLAPLGHGTLRIPQHQIRIQSPLRFAPLGQSIGRARVRSRSFHGKFLQAQIALRVTASKRSGKPNFQPRPPFAIWSNVRLGPALSLPGRINR